MNSAQETTPRAEPAYSAVERHGAAKVLDVKKKTNLLPFIEPMRYAASKHDKSIGSQLWEIWRLALGHNKISPEEYYSLRLFDDAGRGFRDKAEFLGLTAGRRISERCNYNRHWFGILDDKLAFYSMMGGFGFPVPRTVAVYHKKRLYPNFRMLTNNKEFADFLRNTDLYPLFGKPNSSSLSLGVASLYSYNDEKDELRGRFNRSFGLNSFIDDVQQYYSDGYLIQRELEPSDETKLLCGKHLCSLRVMTIHTKRGPEVLCTVWKIPVGKNIADNFWRGGNLLAHVDPSSGAVKRIVQGVGIQQREFSHHPETNRRVVGRVVPEWRKIVDLALSGCEVLPDMRLMGWDIGATVDGPVIIEANLFPHFDLPQIASNEGMRTERLAEFVKHCESERKREARLRRRAKKRSSREYQAKMHKLTLGSKRKNLSGPKRQTGPSD